MIVTAGVATTAFSRALTEDKIERLYEEWAAKPDTDPLREVDSLARDISQDVFWAGLLSDIHDVAWRMYFTEPRDLEVGSLEDVKTVQSYLRELKALTIDEGWWFAYDLDHTALGLCVARQMPLKDWEAGYPDNLRSANFAPWVVASH